jgi:putative membrane protein
MLPRVREMVWRRGLSLAPLAYPGLLAGLAVFTGLIAYQGVREVGAAVAVAGWGLLVVALFHLVPMLADALGWHVLLGTRVGQAGPTAGTMLFARWIGESVNGLLPVMQLGGNVAKIRTLMRRGVPAEPAVASVVVDVTLVLTTQILFAFVGLALLAGRLGGGRLTVVAVAGMAILLSLLGGFVVAQRHGLFGAATRLAAGLMPGEQGDSLVARAAALDAHVVGFYRERRAVAWSGAWHLLSWVLGAGEVWLALRFLGSPVDIYTAVLLESLGQAMRGGAFVVPGAIGVQESGFVLLGQLLGLPPGAGLALSLTKRVRELVLGVPGLIAWQLERPGTTASFDARVVRPASGSAEPAVGELRPAVPSRRRAALARIPFLDLDAAGLIAAARRRTGLEDIEEDATFHTALTRLVDSFEHEARLHPIGWIAARSDTTRLLANRLSLIEARKRHPEIAAQVVRRPLFVTGLPRTGTTLLHGLLAQDPASRAPLHWEMIYPCAAAGRTQQERDRGRTAAARQLRWLHRLAPRLRAIHELGAELPEECLIITSHSFMSLQFQTSHHVPSYEAWLEGQDLTPAYLWHRRFLQHLQSNGSNRQWVLKAPAHLFGLPALFAAYPDADVIFTHRDPTEVSVSLASLTTVLRRVFARVDPVAVGQEMTVRWASAIERACRDRDAGSAPSERFLDVRYADLVADPIGTVRRIYAHYDRPFTPLAEERMRAFLAVHPKDAHGRHEYSAAQFGLDPARERERYRAYCERFGV